MKRKQFSSGTEWEPIVGYSRSYRVGNQIFVSGTTATDENNNIVGKDDAYKQTKQILKNIKNALEALGGRMTDVVRTRMFVTNIDDWQAVGKAHGEVFAKIRPVTTMVEVSKLVNPDMLVEIEAEAIIETKTKSK